MLALDDASRTGRVRVGRLARSATAAALLIGLLDFILLFACGIGTLVVQTGWRTADPTFYAVALFSCSGAFVIAITRNGLYDIESLRHPGTQVSLLLQTGLVVFGLLFLSTTALRAPHAVLQSWTLWWGSIGVLTLVLARMLWWRWAQAAHSHGAYSRRVAILGATPQAQRFLAEVAMLGDVPYRVVGIYDDRRSRLPELAVAGSVRDLECAVRSGAIDDILVAMPWAAEARIRDLVALLRLLPVDVRLLPDLAGFLGRGAQRSYLPGVPTRDLLPRPIPERGLLLKAIFDKVVAAILVVVSLPLMALIAAAIKLTSTGPVIFRQRRCGFNNGTFDVLKFRSMRIEACGEGELRQAVRGDPRVTPVGAFLRRTSLDELPQLFNVLGGTMSLVGPRPHAVQHHELYESLIQGYSFRHKVLPGITGWAQVNGLRGETATIERMAARVAHDAYYVENWSLWLDVKILVRTLVVLLFQSTAY